MLQVSRYVTGYNSKSVISKEKKLPSIFCILYMFGTNFHTVLPGKFCNSFLRIRP